MTDENRIKELKNMALNATRDGRVAMILKLVDDAIVAARDPSTDVNARGEELYDSILTVLEMEYAKGVKELMQVLELDPQAVAVQLAAQEILYNEGWSGV